MVLSHITEKQIEDKFKEKKEKYLLNFIRPITDCYLMSH